MAYLRGDDIRSVFTNERHPFQIILMGLKQELIDLFFVLTLWTRLRVDWKSLFCPVLQSQSSVHLLKIRGVIQTLVHGQYVWFAFHFFWVSFMFTSQKNNNYCLTVSLAGPQSCFRDTERDYLSRNSVRRKDIWETVCVREKKREKPPHGQSQYWF